jgi:hypothetical protein
VRFFILSDGVADAPRQKKISRAASKEIAAAQAFSGP